MTASDSPWTWRCNNTEPMRCIRTPKSTLTPSEYQTLAACKLTCGKYGGLWPKPTGETILSKSVIPFLPENVTVITSFDARPKNYALRAALEAARDIFLGNINKYYPSNIERKPEGKALENRVEIRIRFESSSLALDRLTDESYVLSITRYETVTRVQILSQTFFGARHALETLSQLIAYDELYDSLQILESATVIDRPVFPHRGVMLDTSRNYYSMETLKRLIDGLSHNKLNIFHWHLTDAQSFPICLESRPKFCQYGAYAPWKVYRAADVKELVEYARLRGVRIIPEFDAPSHVGEGWQWAIEEGFDNLIACLRKEPWQKYCYQPPCGVLNPVEDRVYAILQDIYSDFLGMFDTDVFHMGGDEVVSTCWNETTEITDWMDSNGYSNTEDDFTRLWGEKFQRNAERALRIANGAQMPIILWTSHLTRSEKVTEYLNPKDYIIQVWEFTKEEGGRAHIQHLLLNDFKIIMSNVDGSYLDCGYGHWVGPPDNLNWCKPYKSWQAFYENDFLTVALNLTAGLMTPENVTKLVLGGEALMWSESVSEHSLEGKVWPRSAAAAERYWSNPEGGWVDAEWRMAHQTQRMIQLGIRTDAIKPEWCHQNSGLCYVIFSEEIPLLSSEQWEL
ncbi:unnamed protein product [Darwinula stevensoni]|uniref:Beta-hexosaminidase n=1 Tax=Darwinula stevensoni TaxID=69355 RepID=A0A7R8X131_9CRUS|nr:unnamed protein product [Darwinula stevensoni]CAG0879770.1 unnamed protein product [Darwinula stevensoni]